MPTPTPALPRKPLAPAPLAPAPVPEGRVPRSIRFSDEEWALIAEAGRLENIPEPSTAARMFAVLGAQFRRFVRQVEAHMPRSA